MNCQHPTPSAALSTAGNDPARVPRGARSQPPLDGPARPLGSKHAALHRRRQKTRQANRQRVATIPDGTAFTTPDGSVSFLLKASPGGLLIDRSQCKSDGIHLRQSLVFTGTDAFERWCASEPLRFKDPVLYGLLRRQGHDVLAGTR
jgi:hypothetical protein